MKYSQQIRNLSWPFTTQRLLIRPVVESDKQEIYSISTSEYHAKWCGWEVATDYETYSIDWALAPSLTYALIDRNSTKIAGLFELRVDEQNHKCELGYLAHPNFMGQGFITEAGKFFVDLLFSEIGINRIQAHYFSGNKASRKVMEKLGMRFEGHFVDELYKHGKFISCDHYAILRREWLERKTSSTIIDMCFSEALFAETRYRQKGNK